MTIPTPRTPPPLNPLLENPGEYAFLALDRKRRELAPTDVPTIHFGIGDPRERTPEFVRAALRAAVPEVSSYPAVAGLTELRVAAADWLDRRFGVRVDHATELLPVNGTKEGVFLLAFAVVGRESARDTIVIPTPAYPVYAPAARFAGAKPYFVALRSEDGFRFRPETVPDDVWRRTALLWINSPHNPTGSVLGREALGTIAAHARTHGYWVAADEAYAEIYFGDPPSSMLEHGTANVIAFHTLSKRSAMTGYRSGFMAGDRRLIDALRAFRPNIGVATPEFVQHAAIAAWSDDVHAGEQRALYRAKRELMVETFERMGWKIEASEATFYLWVRAPGGDDVTFVERLLRLGIVAAPGSFFGAGGEGWVRWALVPTIAECREAVARLERLAPSGEGDR